MWPVIGHDWAVELFQRCIRTGRTRHAYLIVGPAQVGKTALAKAFAQALLCQGAEQPCLACRACRLVQADRHPDVSLVAPEGSSLRIEAIRELQQMLPPPPGMDRFPASRWWPPRATPMPRPRRCPRGAREAA